MGTIETDNYKINFRVDKKRFANQEPGLEIATLSFKEDNSRVRVGWFNKGIVDEPHFAYEKMDDGVIGHANYRILRNYVDREYKSEFWYTYDGFSQNATDRELSETGKLVETQYSKSQIEGKIFSHFYSERSYSLMPDGNSSRIYYNISDLKNMVEISFGTDGKGNIDKDSIKEKPLNEGRKEYLIEKGEVHFQNVKGFYEDNTKEKELKFDPEKKSGFVDPKGFSDKVGQLSNELKPEQYAFGNKGISSDEVLTKERSGRV